MWVGDRMVSIRNQSQNDLASKSLFFPVNDLFLKSIFIRDFS